MSSDTAKASQRQWYIVGRWEEYEGEGRTNLLRIIGLIVFYAVEPARGRQLVSKYLEAAGGCGCGPSGCGPNSNGVGNNGTENLPVNDFIVKALAEKLSGKDIFRITLNGFLDVHNFDTRRVMKCCLAHLLPSGHMVPFCAYNTLYRDGFLKLPPLATEREPQNSPRSPAQTMSLNVLE